MNTPQEFAPLLAGLRDLPSPQGAALATLTRTSGSTFRRAGARMLIVGDGRIVRGLSGGCPERDIIARALQVIVTDAAQLVRYNREQNFDAMLEMGCGGELEVLIEPLRSASDWQFAETIDRCLQARRSGVLATLFSRDGVCLPRPRRLIWSQTVLADELDNAALSAQLRSAAAALPANAKPQVHGLRSGEREIEVLLETLQPPCAAYLIGNNASSVALARLLLQLGWQVRLIDHQHVDESAVAAHGIAVQAMPPSLLAQQAFDARSFAVVMTHSIEHDIDYLHALRDAPLAYLGAIGARQRVAKLVAATGLQAPRLRAPAGLDIGSETPEEIALAIAAEMLAVANGTSGGVLSESRAPIHR